MRKPNAPRVYPRITEDQLEMIQVQIAKTCDVLNRAPVFTATLERTLANRLGVRKLELLRQPLYPLALQLARADLAQARNLVRHLHAALEAREAMDLTAQDLGLHAGVAYPTVSSFDLTYIKPVAAGQH